MPLNLQNVTFTYMKGTPFEKTALHDVSLQIEKGEFVAVIGHTGSGKSTLVQHLSGLLHPDKGSVTVDGVNLNAKNAAAKKARNSVGMVFQYPEHQIFAETVYEDIAFGPRNKGLGPDETDRAVRDAMAFVGLDFDSFAKRSPFRLSGGQMRRGLDFDSFAKRSPFRLSGGQMRRVAIAGVIAMEPDYLILDEPSAGLDPRSRDAVFKEVMTLYKKRGIAVILVTHNMEEAARYASRLLVISGGQVILDGVPHDIFTNHKDELLAASMDVPPVYKLADCLNAHGLRVERTPELAALEEQILELRRAKHAD